MTTSSLFLFKPFRTLFSLARSFTSLNSLHLEIKATCPIWNWLLTKRDEGTWVSISTGRVLGIVWWDTSIHCSNCVLGWTYVWGSLLKCGIHSVSTIMVLAGEPPSVQTIPRTFAVLSQNQFPHYSFRWWPITLECLWSFCFIAKVFSTRLHSARARGVLTKSARLWESLASSMNRFIES